jgi:uncharacterized protein (DUF433 family)
MAVQLESMLEQSPDVCGGRLRVVGTRITVEHIAALDKQGQSAQTIVENCPYLNHAQVYAALAYYHANRDEIDAALANEEQEFDRLRAEAESSKRP